MKNKKIKSFGEFNENLNISDSISFTDEFNDDATLKLNKGKRLEIIMVDAYGEEQTYFYLDKEMVEKLKVWL